MTVEDVVQAALARAMEFSDSVPSTRSVMYRRVGVRQQQIVAKAAAQNAEYFGVCAVGDLVAGAVDLRAMTPPSVARAERIDKVEIENAGTSVYAAGTEIHVVALLDPAAALAPRATLRNGVLRQVGSDLAGVVSAKVHYAYQPAAVLPTDEARSVEIPEPYSELLVLDLAKELLKKTLELETATKAAALEVLGAEEAEMLADFSAHVGGYAPLTTRFGV